MTSLPRMQALTLGFLVVAVPATAFYEVVSGSSATYLLSYREPSGPASCDIVQGCPEPTGSIHQEVSIGGPAWGFIVGPLVISSLLALHIATAQPSRHRGLWLLVPFAGLAAALMAGVSPGPGLGLEGPLLHDAGDGLRYVADGTVFLGGPVVDGPIGFLVLMATTIAIFGSFLYVVHGRMLVSVALLRSIAAAFLLLLAMILAEQALTAQASISTFDPSPSQPETDLTLSVDMIRNTAIAEGLLAGLCLAAGVFLIAAPVAGRAIGLAMAFGAGASLGPGIMWGTLVGSGVSTSPISGGFFHSITYTYEPHLPQWARLVVLLGPGLLAWVLVVGARNTPSDAGALQG